jgi:hypothetical protein
MEEFEDDNSDDIVHNGPKYRQMTSIDKWMLFYAIRSTMGVEGRPKHGIFSQTRKRTWIQTSDHKETMIGHAQQACPPPK